MDIKETQCSICLEAFTDGDRYPMNVMPCGHTFCKQCCQSLNLCFTCSTLVVPNASVKNTALMEALKNPVQPIKL